MPFLTRWQVLWSGGGISGRAATTFHFELTGDVINGDVLGPIARLFRDTLVAGLGAHVPPAVTMQISPEVQVLDVASGSILSVVTPTDGLGSWQGTGTGAYSVASGAIISLNTASIVRGRRIKGRLFCVPLAGDAYTAGGTLSQAALNDIGATGVGLLTKNSSAGALVVYSRPPKGSSTGGAFHAVTSTNVPPRVAVLRSRRD